MVNIIMAGESLKGRRYVELHPAMSKRNWALFIEKMSVQYPTANKIRLMFDNLRILHWRPYMSPFRLKKQRLYGPGIQILKMCGVILAQRKKLSCHHSFCLHHAWSF